MLQVVGGIIGEVGDGNEDGDDDVVRNGGDGVSGGDGGNRCNGEVVDLVEVVEAVEVWCTN